MDWIISSAQKILLDSLFEKVEGKVEKVLDIGSGRTSIFYLTDRFKNIIVKGIVFPGDNRKIDPIKECVKNTNYELVETDIMNFNSDDKFDAVLAHLFLGEAEKFAGNKYEEILNKLFSIKTRYLIITYFENDIMDRNLLMKYVHEYGEIAKQDQTESRSEEWGISFGMAIKKFN